MADRSSRHSAHACFSLCYVAVNRSFDRHVLGMATALLRHSRLLARAESCFHQSSDTASLVSYSWPLYPSPNPTRFAHSSEAWYRHRADPAPSAFIALHQQHSSGQITAREYRGLGSSPPSSQTSQTPHPTAPALSDQQILKKLLTYVWPSDNPEFKRRVSWALVLLLGSKLLNIQVRG
jgi:hypothetical protein